MLKTRRAVVMGSVFALLLASVTATFPAEAQRKPTRGAPAPKKPSKPSKPSKKELAREEARRKEEERQKEEEARRVEAEQKAAAQRAEEERQQAQAAKAADMRAALQASQASYVSGRRYFEQARRERRRADDEIAGAAAEASRGLLALPILYYSPETDLGVGAFGMYYFHLGAPDKTRTSNIRSSFTYTTRKQTLFDIGPTLWLMNDAINLNGIFSYTNYPNFYAGVGNRTPSTLLENYTERFPQIYTQIQYRLVGPLYAGLRYRFETRQILDKEAGRALDSGNVVGAQGGILSGLGVTLSYDTRDNVQAPSKGSYAYAGLRENFRAIGSDYAFTEVDVDLRQYFGIGQSVLALQVVGGTNAGNVPFYALSTIGGGSLLRGISYGRFRDIHLVEGQAEFRFPIWGRWGGTFFGGAGEVMHSAFDFNFKGLHPAGGTGLRFAVVPSERLNIRVDFAYAEAGLTYYLNIGEAF